MRLKFKPTRVVNVVLGIFTLYICLILIAFSFFMTNMVQPQFPSPNLQEDTTFNYGRLYNQKNKAENEYSKAKMALEDFTNPFSSGNETQLDDLAGVDESTYCETCTSMCTHVPSALEKKMHFFVLYNYIPTKGATKRYIYYGQHGKLYKALPDRFPNDSSFISVKETNYIVMHSEENSSGTQPEPKTIKVQISSSSYHFFLYLFVFATLAFIFLTCYVAFGDAIKVILEISMGRAFTQKNCKRLFRIGYILLAFCISALLIQLIPYWCFKNALDNEWKPDINKTNYFYGLFSSAFVLFIAFAFKKGTRMQQEQDLTI